jgi:hypothetical protein
MVNLDEAAISSEVETHLKVENVEEVGALLLKKS